MAPHPKRVAEGRAHLVRIDEPGLLLDPLARRTWALRGETPAVGGGGGPREKVSVTRAVRVPPAARHLGLYSSAPPDGSFDAGAAAGLLRDLLKHPRGKVAAAWDGGPRREGPRLRELLRRNRGRAPERRPASAPDLSPVGAVWSWLTCGPRANYAPDGIPGWGDQGVERMIGPRFGPGAVKVLWERADLPLPQGPNV